jgi:hypothetical protein
MKRIDGEPVANSATHLRLRITEDDIARGVRGQPNACAIAVAAMHRIKGCTAAQIHRRTAYLNIHGKWKRFAIPDALWAEIVAFDRGGKFWAGEHDLSAPPLHDLIPKKKRARSSSNTTRSGGNRKPRPRHVVPGLRETGQRNEPARSTKGE